jgi:hypothetical protein
MKRLLFLLLLALVALGVLLWRLPASAALIVLPANANWQRFVNLHEVSGTIWNGSARFSTVASPAAQRVQWQCAPAFATASIACNLGGGIAANLSLKPFSQSIAIPSLSAQQAINFAPNAAAAFSAESVALTLKDAILARDQMSFTGSLVAKDASFAAGNTTTALGEAFVDCTPANDAKTTQCTIKNRASSTRLDGSISISPARANGSINVTTASGSTQKLSF